MGKRQRRAGATETFSVSVDSETKKALRELADSEFGGNLSALVTDLADEARRRKAAGDLLKRHGFAKLTADAAATLRAEIDAEVAGIRKKAKKRKAA